MRKAKERKIELKRIKTANKIADKDRKRIVFLIMLLCVKKWVMIFKLLII